MRPTAPDAASTPSVQLPTPPGTLTTGRWWGRAAAAMGPLGPLLAGALTVTAMLAACRWTQWGFTALLSIGILGLGLQAMAGWALRNWVRETGCVRNAVRAWGSGDQATAELWVTRLTGPDARAWLDAVRSSTVSATQAEAGSATTNIKPASRPADPDPDVPNLSNADASPTPADTHEPGPVEAACRSAQTGDVQALSADVRAA